MQIHHHEMIREMLEEEVGRFPFQAVHFHMKMEEWSYPVVLQELWMDLYLLELMSCLVVGVVVVLSPYQELGAFLEAIAWVEAVVEAAAVAVHR